MTRKISLKATRQALTIEVDFFLQLFPNNESLKDLMLDAKSESLTAYEGDPQRAIDDYARLAYNLAYPETIEQPEPIQWADYV